MGNFLLTLTQRWETIKQYPILTRHANKKEKIFYTEIENWKTKLEN